MASSLLAAAGVVLVICSLSHISVQAAGPAFLANFAEYKGSPSTLQSYGLVEDCGVAGAVNGGSGKWTFRNAAVQSEFNDTNRVGSVLVSDTTTSCLTTIDYYEICEGFNMQFLSKFDRSYSTGLDLMGIYKFSFIPKENEKLVGGVTYMSKGGGGVANKWIAQSNELPPQAVRVPFPGPYKIRFSTNSSYPQLHLRYLAVALDGVSDNTKTPIFGNCIKKITTSTSTTKQTTKTSTTTSTTTTTKTTPIPTTKTTPTTTKTTPIPTTTSTSTTKPPTTTTTHIPITTTSPTTTTTTLIPTTTTSPTTTTTTPIPTTATSPTTTTTTPIPTTTSTSTTKPPTTTAEMITTPTTTSPISTTTRTTPIPTTTTSPTTTTPIPTTTASSTTKTPISTTTSTSTTNTPTTTAETTTSPIPTITRTTPTPTTTTTETAPPPTKKPCPPKSGDSAESSSGSSGESKALIGKLFDGMVMSKIDLDFEFVPKKKKCNSCD